MQMNRQRLSINAWFALALMLGSLWVGGLATTSAGDPSDYLAKRAQQRMQSAALPDLVVALRPAPERSGSFGRLVRLLLAVLVAAYAAGYWRRAAGPRPGLTRVSRVPAPPHAKFGRPPGFSRPDRRTAPTGDRCRLMLEVRLRVSSTLGGVFAAQRRR
mgnify:CR=1 FL=1